MRLRRWIVVALLVACGALAGCEVPVTRMPISTRSEKARNLYLKGRDALDEMRIDEARRRFKLALREDPEFALAQLALAQLTTDEEESFQFLVRAEALAERVTFGERLVILAARAAADGDRDAEFSHLQQLVESYPEDERGQVRLGDSYLSYGNYPHAVRCYKEALKLAPDLATAFRGLGRSYLQVGRFEQADEALRRFAELAPDAAPPQLLVGDLRLKLGQFEDARAAYETALELEASSAARIGIGNSLLLADRYEEAREWFRNMLQAAVDDRERGTARMWIAATHLHEGAFEQALTELQAAVDESEAVPQTRAALLELMGNVQLESGKIADAEATFERVVNTLQQADVSGPARMTARVNRMYNQARVQLARKDLESARKRLLEYRRSLGRRTEPHAKDRFSELSARIALLEGDPTTALKHLERSNSENPRLIHLTAQIQEASGETDGALATYQRVARWNEADIDLALVRANARSRAAEL